ncbi:MAG TPA: PspA/IM30 family protein [Spirochaetia bacterium]|nr:PspA/IM30 family protein [Spirochaetia bacterium]
MSILKRIFKVGEAKANQLIDKMEKPELMLEQAVRDQTQSIREAKEKVAQVIATERQNKALLDRETAGAAEWEQKAQLALKAGNEDLASKALIRSEEFAQRAAVLQPQWEAQRKSVEGLKVDIRRMEDELAEFKRNKDLIIAQSKAAEVKKEIYEAKAKISKNDTGALIERMKAKAERTSYQAEAAEEMAAEVTKGDSLEKEFKKLGSTSASQVVQDKLAAMKAKLLEQQKQG